MPFKLLFKAQLFIFSFCLPCILVGKQIDTFYGPLDVDEPVVLELIESPVFQRLKHIHQYGVAYYTTHKEEYNRYDHSLGVFAVLRVHGASLEEQIAGLLHDVSHTVFSHVGDWIFKKANQEKDYQNSIHTVFLEKSGLAAILRRYHYNSEQFFPQEQSFPALENSLPDLCADRIDYNIQGAYYQGFITYEEAISIFTDLRFIDNRWVSSLPEQMKKLVRFSLLMTQECWGSPTNYLTSQWLADAIIRGLELGCISYEELHFGTDQVIWEKLIHHQDPCIQENIHKVLNSQDFFSITDFNEADMVIKSKFRGINPWIQSKSSYERLLSIDPELQKEYEEVQQTIGLGWPIKLEQSSEAQKF